VCSITRRMLMSGEELNEYEKVLAVMREEKESA
jgi:hypothetical protein